MRRYLSYAERVWHHNKKIAREKGVSQEKFVLSIGMDRTYYASVEAGKRNISLQNICKIAEGFGLFVSTLFAIVEKGGI